MQRTAVCRMEAVSVRTGRKKTAGEGGGGGERGEGGARYLSLSHSVGV
jgi:hypothetical protein